MTVTIELSPEVEARISVMAAGQGLAVSEYLQKLIAEQVSAKTGKQLSLAERAAVLRNTSHLPATPPLSDEAISRESMYDLRG